MHGKIYAASTVHENTKKDTKKISSDSRNKENHLGNIAWF